ncbi:hypothetical protein [uncultured Jatrophihabitans sp.]|uniref:hypothetical protein n=1 Tax=uncultured Jatrophihabitans sp. TaxID=1610747 RepID=UPI0035CA39D9
MIDDTTPDGAEQSPNKQSPDDAPSDDRADTSPASTGHSDADTQTQRNTEDESPS